MPKVTHLNSTTSGGASVPAGPVQVIAITAGKGGVGKTTIAVNLALALGRMGKRSLLLDADLGLANIDTLLGLQPTRNLSHVLAGECDIADVVLPVYPNVDLIPAASGISRMAELSTAEQAGIIRAFSNLTHNLDVLIVDNAPGLSSTMLRFTRAAHRALVVVCDDPASITDAYAVIKVLSREYGLSRFNILVNKTEKAGHAGQVFSKISRVADRFLDVHLTLAGEIPKDKYVERATQEQAGVVVRYPGSVAARCFHRLAKETSKWETPSSATGNLEFFVERTLAASAYDTGDAQR